MTSQGLHTPSGNRVEGVKALSPNHDDSQDLRNQGNDQFQDFQNSYHPSLELKETHTYCNPHVNVDPVQNTLDNRVWYLSEMQDQKILSYV